MQEQSLATSYKQTDAQPVSEQWLVWEDQAPLFLLLSIMSSYGLSFWLIWFSHSVHFPSKAVVCLQPACGGMEHSGKQKVLVLCKHCSTITKPQVCYQHDFDHKTKHSTMQVAVGRVNSIPARLKIHYKKIA